MAGYQILIRPPGSDWGVVGRDHGPGVTPEGLRLTADQWGPQDCSFTLKRDSRVPWPDLTPFTDVEVHSDNAGVVWGGRIWSVNPGARDTIGVTARGWQYLLDDNPIRKTYFRAGLQGFVDIRSGPAATLNMAVFPPDSDFQVGVGNTLQVSIQAGSHTTNEGALAIIDLGAADARGIAVDWADVTNGNASVAFVVQGYDDPAWTTGGVNASFTPAATSGIATSGTLSGATFSSAKRYVGIGLQCTAPVTLANPVSIRITGVRVTPDTSLMSSGASALLASDVVTDIIGDLTDLDPDTSRVETTATVIPDLHTSNQYETPRQILERANAYHDYLLGVDAAKRMYFRARPSVPLIQIGDDTGATYADAGDTAEELYNQVVVTGLEADGATTNTVRTATSPLLDLNGYTRTKVLTNQATLTTAAAQVIGDAWLDRRKDKPTRGVVTITGNGAATMVENGAPVTPMELLRHPGELIRIGNRWSPDDGSNARDGVIANVSVMGDTDTATVNLDSPQDRFEVLLTRYAALRAARPANY